MYGLLGIFILIYGIAALLCNFWAFHDLSKREFISIEEKNYWRKLISWNPFGGFRYFIKYGIKTKKN